MNIKAVVATMLLTASVFSSGVYAEAATYSEKSAYEADAEVMENTISEAEMARQMKRKERQEKQQTKHEQALNKMRESQEDKALKREKKEEKNRVKEQWKQDEALKDEALFENQRYFSISKDKLFTYFMDIEDSRWIRCPYKADEYIVDVWIKLIKNDDLESLKNGEIDEISTYYMEHYYMRPEPKELQFLSEMEISRGRPNNDIQERKYSPMRWERLVPGSIEDSVYHGVMRTLKKHNLLKGKKGNNDTLLDRFHTITSSVAEALGIYI